jgi:hypothetical protein
MRHNKSAKSIETRPVSSSAHELKINSRQPRRARGKGAAWKDDVWPGILFYCTAF